MELRQLRYFLKTAETLNFSVAARALFITQSTLSQQIRQLESDLGVDLFQRDSHSVRLTEHGQQLLPLALRTIQDAESCYTSLKDLDDLLSGTLNIGITYTFAPVLKEAVRTFVKLYPGVRINVVCSSMESLLSSLKAGEVDFVLCYKPTGIDSDIESHTLFEGQLSAIVSEDHPLARKSKVGYSDLLMYEFAMPPKGSQARLQFGHCYPKASSELKVKLEIGEVNVLLDIVRSTHLVTVLSDTTLFNRTGLKAIMIDAEHTLMEGCVHTLKKVYRKRSAEEFIRVLENTNAVMERVHKWIR